MRARLMRARPMRTLPARALLFAAGALLGNGATAATTLKLVEVLTSPERTETLRVLVQKFENRNPGVHVEITSLPWGSAFEKFATMVSAGDVPDVVEMPDRWASLYAGNGKLESLEPYLAAWSETAGLSERTLQMARSVNHTAYLLPYGIYLRALIYNRKLFRQAGVDAPPRTLEEFVAAAKKVSALPGKYGYCMRGGQGGLNSWMIFGATVAGTGEYFRPDGTSTLADPGWIRGFTWFIDLYRNGLAPRDSVNWGFNEVVAGFYAGNCAMLDQDPDALIAIAQRMKPEDYGVAPLPKGPSGKAFPTTGWTGWSIFRSSEHKDLGWKLIEALDDPAGNLVWNRRVGALPVYRTAEKDPLYATPQLQGWFAELADKDQIPQPMPTWLPGFAWFADSLVVRTGQQALLGQVSPTEMARQWAAYLTRANQKMQAAH